MMISLLLPSRGRPHRAAEMIQSAFETASNRDMLAIGLKLDDEDESLPQYRTMRYALPFRHSVAFVLSPGTRLLSDTYNMICRWTSAEIIGYMADDITFATPGWDEVVREHFRQHPVSLLADSQNPSDPHNNPMHGFVSRRAVEALGYLTPPYFEHGYTDRWLLDVYDLAGVAFFTDKYRIDHHHFVPEPDKMDETYRKRSMERDAQGLTCDDRDRLVFDAKEAERRADAEKLRRLLCGLS